MGVNSFSQQQRLVGKGKALVEDNRKELSVRLNEAVVA